MAKTILDFLDMMVAREERKSKEITYEEWCYIRRNGSPEEIEAAVERMMSQGGYDNLG